MGDTGSSLRWSFSCYCYSYKSSELTLIVVAGVFVIETLTSIIQLTSVKLTGKRVFLMAPLHHHFEKLGWKETI